MYDTRFFVNTYDLKNKIINGQYKKDNAKELYEELNAHLNEKPFVFNIETTSYCNMTCVMCQRTTDFNRKARHMDDRTYGNIISQIAPQAGEDMAQWQKFTDLNLRDGNLAPSENNFYYDIVSQAVTLHGFGEPILDPNLVRRVRALTAKGIPSYFSCNPCNIKLDVLEELYKAGVGHVKFAIDSMDDQEARKIRGKLADFTESYKKTIKAIKLRDKLDTGTNIVVAMLDFFDDNEKEKAFLDLWKDMNVYAYVKSADNKWLLNKKEEGNLAKAENKSHYKKQYCEYAFTSMTILEDGSAVPCTQDINGSVCFGNVNEQSLFDIWNSDKYKEFRKLQVRGGYDDDFICHSKCDLDIVESFLK